jgi:hypothetical protein
MPSPPRGWSQRFSSNLVVYEPPAGPGRIRCFQDQPLEPISRVAARVGAGVIAASERVTTAEGEYGALCRSRDDRALGLVFGDTHAVAIEGPGEHAEQVRDLVARWRLELGIRPRRLLYRSPPGWSAMPNGLVTTWMPSGFPNDHAELLVYAAAPLATTPQDELMRLIALEQVRIVGEVGERTFTTSRGLAATHAVMTLEMRAGFVRRELVLLHHAPYRYAVKLETTGEPRYRDVLLDLVDSIEPLPGAAAADSFDLTNHWAD